MKRLIACALLLNASAHAMHKIADTIGTKKEAPFDADLFKKDAQIFSADVGFLYWAAAEGALDYAISMNHAAWGPSASYAQGNFDRAGFGMNPGFRLGLRYFRAPHYWEVEWQYTRFTGQGINEVNKPAPDQQYLTGTFPQITTFPLTKATSSIHLNYNVGDMVVTRVFFPNPHLRLRILGGALMSWMSQDWNVHYYDTASNTTSIRNSWQYIGGGLKSGSMVDWYWTGDLYMTAMGTISLLVGTYSNHSKQTTTFSPTVNDDPSVPVRNAEYRDVRPAFSAQMMLGPSWQKNYPKNRVEVFAGFEANMWMNLQEVYRSTASSASSAKETWINTGVLTLYGLTTRLTVDF